MRSPTAATPIGPALRLLPYRRAGRVVDEHAVVSAVIGAHIRAQRVRRVERLEKRIIGRRHPDVDALDVILVPKRKLRNSGRTFGKVAAFGSALVVKADHRSAAIAEKESHASRTGGVGKIDSRLTRGVPSEVESAAAGLIVEREAGAADPYAAV